MKNSYFLIGLISLVLSADFANAEMLGTSFSCSEGHRFVPKKVIVEEKDANLNITFKDDTGLTDLEDLTKKLNFKFPPGFRLQDGIISVQFKKSDCLRKDLNDPWVGPVMACNSSLSEVSFYFVYHVGTEVRKERIAVRTAAKFQLDQHEIKSLNEGPWSSPHKAYGSLELSYKDGTMPRVFDASYDSCSKL